MTMVGMDSKGAGLSPGSLLFSSTTVAETLLPLPALSRHLPHSAIAEQGRLLVAKRLPCTADRQDGGAVTEGD